jgi:hypothetical protein
MALIGYARVSAPEARTSHQAPPVARGGVHGDLRGRPPTSAAPDQNSRACLSARNTSLFRWRATIAMTCKAACCLTNRVDGASDRWLRGRSDGRAHRG